MDHPLAFIGVILLVIVAVIGGGVYYESLYDSVCEYGNVTSIGGCDRNGRCGVTLSNNWTTSTWYPTIGERVAVNCKRVRKQ